MIATNHDAITIVNDIKPNKISTFFVLIKDFLINIVSIKPIIIPARKPNKCPKMSDPYEVPNNPRIAREAKKGIKGLLRLKNSLSKILNDVRIPSPPKQAVDEPMETKPDGSIIEDKIFPEIPEIKTINQPIPVPAFLNRK